MVWVVSSKRRLGDIQAATLERFFRSGIPPTQEALQVIGNRQELHKPGGARPLSKGQQAAYSVLARHTDQNRDLELGKCLETLCSGSNASGIQKHLPGFKPLNS